MTCPAETPEGQSVGVVKNMSYMFDGASSFNQDISTFEIPNLYNAINILTNSGFYLEELGFATHHANLVVDFLND